MMLQITLYETEIPEHLTFFRSGISNEKARLKFIYIFMSTDMVKTYLKTVLSKILLTQLKSDIGL
jgi:uncharacterized membrane protein